MSVEADCPHENQRQRKRRRGIAQLSLSSLHNAETFHVNHNHLKNQLSTPGVETIAKPRDDEAVPMDEKIHGDLNNFASPLNSVEKQARLRRRRRKRIEIECKEQTQQKEVENSDTIQSVASPHDRAVTKDDEVDMYEIEEICSVGYFRATPLDEFRQRCRRSFERSLESSSNVSLRKGGVMIAPFGLIQYDRFEIIRRFTNDIDWKNLCEHHDKRKYKRENHVQDDRSSKTALSEIIWSMTDPAVIPSCCQSKCLMDILLNALLMSPSMSVSLQKRRKVSNTMQRWTPSQQLLLKTIRRLLLSQGVSPDSCVLDYVRNFVLFRPPCLSTLERGTNTTSASILSPNKVNRLLSAIYWLLSASISPRPLPRHLETDLVSSGLLLLQRIDGWSIQIDAESQKTHDADKSIVCFFCKKNSSDTQTSNGNGSRRYINRNVTVKTMSDLHDEAIDIESNFAQKPYNNNKLPWRRSFGNNPKKLSLKDVLTMKKIEGIGSATKCTCNGNHESRKEKRDVASATNFTVLSSDWSTVCSRAYKKFLSYSAERRQQQHTRELSSNEYTTSRAIEKHSSDEGFLQWLVNDAVLNYGSSSRRVCMALVAHSFGGPNNSFYFTHVAHLFWEGYLRSGRQQNDSSSPWLRLYCEWVSDCAVFDQQEIAWEAFQPILEHVSEVIASNEEEDFDVNDGMNSRPDHICDEQETNRNLNAPLMACVGYILHRRSYLFRGSHRVSKGRPSTRKNDSIPESTIGTDFQSFINNLSLCCGEDSKLWLSLFSDSTRDLVESTLQRLGVLSISIRDSEEQINNSNTSVGLDLSISDMSMKAGATSNWPFREEFGFRKAMGRVDQGVLSLENGIHPEKLLLSNCSTDYLSVGEKKKAEARSSKTPVSSVPMTNYIHDGGILSLIFSFCGSIQLTKIPLVCKSWKLVSDTVSNSLWENAYISRFGKYRWPCLEAEQRHRFSICAIISIDSKCSSKETENTRNTYWKNMFKQKQIAESIIRFKRNSRTGYKYRTCNYLGCLHVLRTSEQEQKHDQMHLRQLAKQQASLQKKQLRKKNTNGSKSRGRKTELKAASQPKQSTEKKKESR